MIPAVEKCEVCDNPRKPDSGAGLHNGWDRDVCPSCSEYRATTGRWPDEDWIHGQRLGRGSKIYCRGCELFVGGEDWEANHRDHWDEGEVWAGG